MKGLVSVNGEFDQEEFFIAPIGSMVYNDCLIRDSAMLSSSRRGKTPFDIRRSRGERDIVEVKNLSNLEKSATKITIPRNVIQCLLLRQAQTLAEARIQQS